MEKRTHDIISSHRLAAYGVIRSLAYRPFASILARVKAHLISLAQTWVPQGKYSIIKP